MTACIYFTQVSHTSKGSTDASGRLIEQVCLVGGRGRRRWWRGPVSERAALCWQEGVAITNTATENRKVFQNRGRSKCGTRGHGQA